MKQYLKLLKLVANEGDPKTDRTGIGTLSLFGQQMRFNLAGGFPLVTTKQCHLRSIIHELLWFLKGDTTLRYLKENKVRIWDDWVKNPVYEDLGAVDVAESIIHNGKRVDSAQVVVMPHGLNTNLSDGTVLALGPTENWAIQYVQVVVGKRTMSDKERRQCLREQANYEEAKEAVLAKMIEEGGSFFDLMYEELDVPTTVPKFGVQASIVLAQPFVRDTHCGDLRAALIEALRTEGVTHQSQRLVDGELGPIYGKQWRDIEDVRLVREEEIGDYTSRGFELAGIFGYEYSVEGGKDAVMRRQIDQLSNVVNQLKANPDSRRLIVSAWNPAEVDEMALPPCHALFQFYTDWRAHTDIVSDIIDSDIEIDGEDLITVYDREMAVHRTEGNILPLSPQHTAMARQFAEKHGIATRRLSCQLYQRSADIFLGVPFNIASYALLTMMIAQVTNMVPGDFIWIGGDCHLYLNHLDQANEQLQRSPKALPTMRLNPAVKDLFSFTYEDFTLDGYDPWPAISAPVAV